MLCIGIVRYISYIITILNKGLTEKKLASRNFIYNNEILTILELATKNHKIKIMWLSIYTILP